MMEVKEEDLGKVSETGDALSAFDAPDISPEQHAEHLANLFANALESTKIFKSIEVRAGVGQVHVLGRVRKDNERKFLEDVVHPILIEFDKNEDCDGYCGKQFLLKDDDVKYAWVVSLTSNDLRRSIAQLCRGFESAIPVRKVEVTEAPLLGPSTPQSGGNQTGKKGAAPVGAR
jgi:hypothetical protein